MIERNLAPTLRSGFLPGFRSPEGALSLVGPPAARTASATFQAESEALAAVAP